MDTLITQSIGFAAMAFCIGSYQCKTGRGLMLCKTVGDLLYVLHYLLLSSYSGCVTLLVAAGNQLIYSCRDRWKWARWPGWRWIFSVLMAVSCVVGWRDDLRPANICAMVSMLSVVLTTWTDDAWVMRLNKLFCAGPLWLVYAMAAGSISSVLCEAIGMTSAAIGLYRCRAGGRAPDRAVLKER